MFGEAAEGEDLLLDPCGTVAQLGRQPAGDFRCGLHGGAGVEEEGAVTAGQKVFDGLAHLGGDGLLDGRRQGVRLSGVEAAFS